MLETYHEVIDETHEIRLASTLPLKFPFKPQVEGGKGAGGRLVTGRGGRKSPFKRSPRECAPPPSEAGGGRRGVCPAAASPSCPPFWVFRPAAPVELGRRRL